MLMNSFICKRKSVGWNVTLLFFISGGWNRGNWISSSIELLLLLLLSCYPSDIYIECRDHLEILFLRSTIFQTLDKKEKKCLLCCCCCCSGRVLDFFWIESKKEEEKCFSLITSCLLHPIGWPAVLGGLRSWPLLFFSFSCGPSPPIGCKLSFQ